MERSKAIRPFFSVGDFIAILNQSLEFSYPMVDIEGEVSSYKVNQGKFIFFDVKDDEGCLSCFATVWQMRLPIEDGMKVVVSGTPKLTKWGKFSLTVKSVRPSGEGAIKKSFDLLKAKLEKEGLFATDRKRPLSEFPERVAVISSTDAAGYADFVKIVNDRWCGVKIDVAHVQVQGVGASDQIVHALNYFNQQEELADVLVIVRGGGSADDLSTFNDEVLARAIASSRIPTLVGVGHETDISLADLVADVRAATPSNAAQILVPDKTQVIQNIKLQVGSLGSRMRQVIDQQSIGVKDQVKRIVDKIDQVIDDKYTYVQNMKKVLTQLDPNIVLARGYALVRGEFKKGSQIEIETNNVILEAEVKDVKRK